MGYLHGLPVVSIWLMVRFSRAYIYSTRVMCVYTQTLNKAPRGANWQSDIQIPSPMPGMSSFWRSETPRANGKLQTPCKWYHPESGRGKSKNNSLFLQWSEYHGGCVYSCWTVEVTGGVPFQRALGTASHCYGPCECITRRLGANTRRATQ